jgi:hypothetical protein
MQSVPDQVKCRREGAVVSGFRRRRIVFLVYDETRMACQCNNARENRNGFGVLFLSQKRAPKQQSPYIHTVQGRT